MIILEINTKEKYEVNFPAHRSGEIQTKCPVCADNRKRGNENKKPLMFNVGKGTGKCFNCDSVFVEFKDRPMTEKIEKEYKRPEWKNNTSLSENVVKWFEGRGITQFVLRQMKITEGLEWMPQTEKNVNTIQFNYFRGEELINVKYRDGAKNFKLAKDAELIFYNINAIESSMECLICEGEIDCLSWIQAGYKYAISVPNGAGKKTQNLQYLDNCIDYFENKTKIYISYDNDEPGNNLKNELVRRLGAERCFLIDLEGEKDANDYLKKYGQSKLIETLQYAKDIPIEGVFTCEDFEVDLDFIFQNGLKEGYRIGLSGFDELMRIETGRLAIVTAIPGHGKSEFVDEVVERLNVFHGWKAAYFSPENFPLQYHGKKIIEKLTGKVMSSRYMDSKEYIKAKIYLNDNFSFIMPKDDQFSLDNILDKARQLVLKKGIKTLVIDPWNRLEYQQDKGETETKYVARQLIKMVNFAKINDVFLVLIAHPTKIGKNAAGEYDVPNLYSISGSANFFNITDYGITIYRRGDETDVHVQKVKFKHLGERGMCSFRYDTSSGRYASIDSEGHFKFENESHIEQTMTLRKSELEYNPNRNIEPNRGFDFDNITKENEAPY